MFAIIDNPTIVERPHRRPFLGVTYRLREGVILWQRAPRGQTHGGPAAPSSPPPAGSVWTRRVHHWDTRSCRPIIKTARHLQPAEGHRPIAVGRARRCRAVRITTTRTDHLVRWRRHVRVPRRSYCL